MSQSRPLAVVTGGRRGIGAGVATTRAWTSTHNGRVPSSTAKPIAIATRRVSTTTTGIDASRAARTAES